MESAPPPKKNGHTWMVTNRLSHIMSCNVMPWRRKSSMGGNWRGAAWGIQGYMGRLSC